ncbi:MAG: hypothetical protein ABI255_08755 [Microbacteriaceae bacterium]
MDAPPTPTTSPESASPTATFEDAAPTATPEGAAPTATEYKTLAVATRTYENLSLSGGEVLALGPGAHVLAGPIANPAVPFNDNALAVDGNYDSDTGPSATLVYQVNWHGQPSGYWIAATFTADAGSLGSSCIVYQGKPPAAGGQGADPSPYNCSFHQFRDFPKAGVEIDLSLNKVVEAQARINTEGPISLQGGHYESNLIPTHLDGSATVPENSSAWSDVVLNDGDQPIDPYLAKTTFVYQIVDAGIPRMFWVMGHSQNYDGSKYTGESTCAVYDRNPLTATGDPDLLKPVNVSAYTCTQTAWEFVGGDRGNYLAKFAVAKRAMQTLSDPLEQKRMVAQFCSDATNCGLSLATVQDTYGPGRRVSSVVNNPSDSRDVLLLATSNTQSISNSGGFEIDVEAGMDIGFDFKTTLKVNYQRDVTNTTTTTQTIRIVIPPHSRGWIEGTPPMVHTVGEIIVRDGDRYFDLTNVVADFPNATTGHSDWEYTTPNEKLPSSPVLGSGEGGSSAGAPIIALPVTPGSDAPDTPVTTQSAAAGLAKTGSTLDAAPYLAGMLAILAGIGLISTRRARRRSQRARRG